MSIELRVPPLPESVSDATVLSWHKQPGDKVRRDETLVDLETDKVVLEVPAPEAGTLKEILHQNGDTVEAEAVLAKLEIGATDPMPGTPADQPQPVDIPLSPSVRGLIKEHGIDPARIKGSGKNGRILKADVESFLDSYPDKPSIAVPAREIPASRTSELQDEARPEERVHMTRLRRKIAERLVEAQRAAAILTTFNEVNLQAVAELRSKYRDSFEQRHEVKLGFMSFFVKASVEALKQYPIINASVDGEEIVYHGYFDIGIAVSSPRGLVVPILRDADQLSFSQIEKTIRTFGTKAKDGTLSYEELTGGTFSITNGGVFGSMLSTPILNPPQSAILGMHAIQQRPVVEHGEIVIRPMMYLALSYDHRIVDGRDAVRFLVSVKQQLEDPARLLLEI
ncbi:MAG: 2-oxoglutarate dehydrogenase complex dihydrolipoyllysine-residue succinyltransferase [Gammaproteobacteria bacterium]|nr:2-oxoglutarate dehydrogenase complex dihydrolipoyllysine-residue succinyltransferase [Gammaproteobacteria bacterium]